MPLLSSNVEVEEALNNVRSISLFSAYGDKFHSMTLKMGTLLNKESLDIAQKFSFPLRIFSFDVTNSPVSCGFTHIYWRNP